MADLNLLFLDNKQNLSVCNDRFMIIMSKCNGISQIKLTIKKNNTRSKLPR